MTELRGSARSALAELRSRRFGAPAEVRTLADIAREPARWGSCRRGALAGALALAVSAAPLPWITWSSTAGWALWLTVTLAVAGTVAIAVSALDTRAIDSTRRERNGRSIEPIQRLADLAAATPKPLLELDEAGHISYMNASMRRLLAELEIPEDRAHEALPPDVAYHVARALGGLAEQIDWEVRGRVVHYAFQCLPERRAVVAAGTDLTVVRRIESELRAINLDLEAIVDARARDTQEATALCLARLAEIRDPETGTHLERTKRYIAALAHRLATHERYRHVFDEETIDLLMRTAPLHDIGKVGVPDSILCKPARLSHEETIEMQKHPIFGGDALEWVAERLGSNRFFDLAKEIAYHHHERWDGSGYPFGLAGEEIPISARLMALADVYDALRSPRVYRSSLPHEEVRDIILQDRGRHFDPDVVDAFLACEEVFREISSTQGDHEPVVMPIDALEHAATAALARTRAAGRAGDEGGAGDEAA